MNEIPLFSKNLDDATDWTIYLINEEKRQDIPLQKTQIESWVIFYNAHLCVLMMRK